jgi:aryl-alcohol dehydrogenase-like predicted oxidoreductase
MEYRPLGRSGVKVSSLCLGCMNFGGRTSEEDAARIIHAAIERGINFLDTANVYGQGVSETIVGKALAEGGRRDQVFLATKVTSPMGDGPNDRGSSRYHVLHQCEASLRRLRTDHIDLYQLHRMDLATPLDESLRVLDDLVRQGKVLYTGISNCAPALLVEALMLSERQGWAKYSSMQPPYNLLDRRVENEMTWVCLRHGVGMIPWAPIGTGLLSGKYGTDGPPPGPNRFTEFNARLTPAAVERANALKPLAAEKGVSLAEFALAWVMRQPGVTAPIIGVRTMEHLDSALKVLDVTFSEDDRRRIDAVAPPGSAVSDYYDVNYCAPLRRAAGVVRE